MNILQNSPGGGGGWNNKLFWGKFSKISILWARSAPKNQFLYVLCSEIYSFSWFLDKIHPKFGTFLINKAFSPYFWNIWHLLLRVWQIFSKIARFACQQNKNFRKTRDSMIRISWKNIHPWLLLQQTWRNIFLEVLEFLQNMFAVFTENLKFYPKWFSPVVF